MFIFFRKKRIKKYAEEASAYVQQKYIAPPMSTGIQFSFKETPVKKHREKKNKPVEAGLKHQQQADGMLYSERDSEKQNTPSVRVKHSLAPMKTDDPYDATEVTRLLRDYSTAGNFNEVLKSLEGNVNQSFVDRLLYYIKEKGVRDSEVYKAAQVDKRLFSKMVSNREYKPSKDTAIALALALELSLEEANDMLSRAGYAFSHSNKRDIIVEFFFRENVYSLFDVNAVLHRLNQKIIGRF